MPTETTKILVVEDSVTQAIQLQDLLEQRAFLVEIASHGREALEKLEKSPFDLVISDIVMPEMDGYELCHAIKEDDRLKEIPVFLLTSLSEPDDIIKGLACGANHFVTKPYDAEALLATIAYTVANKELRRRSHSNVGIEVYFSGQRHFINSDRIQILDLLFSSYEEAMRQKKKLEEANEKLQETMASLKMLKGLIPICSFCKKIRDDEGAWNKLEKYIQDHSDATFSHGICPECMKDNYGEYLAPPDPP